MTDFDGDAHADLATLDGSIVSLCRGRGDGTFWPCAQVGKFTAVYGLVVGDFNNDKRLDLAVLQPEPENYVFIFENEQ